MQLMTTIIEISSL